MWFIKNPRNFSHASLLLLKVFIITLKAKFIHNCASVTPRNHLIIFQNNQPSIMIVAQQVHAYSTELRKSLCIVDISKPFITLFSSTTLFAISILQRARVPKVALPHCILSFTLQAKHRSNSLTLRHIENLKGLCIVFYLFTPCTPIDDLTYNLTTNQCEAHSGSPQLTK